VELFVILACWATIGIFELSEMALVSSNRRRLTRLAEDGSKGAKAALELLANPSKFLSTVQVGLTFGSIIAATFGGAPLAAALQPHLEASSFTWLHDNAANLSRMGVSFVIGSLTIICAEIVPKRLGLSDPEGLAVLLASDDGRIDAGLPLGQHAGLLCRYHPSALRPQAHAGGHHVGR
jgi:putative hemolysin